MDSKVTGCQSTEEFVTCSTNEFIKSIVDQCHCLPLSLRRTKEEPLCKLDGLRCYTSITVNSSQCLPNCEGLLITSFMSKKRDDVKLDHFLSNIKEQYDQFKGLYKFPPALKGILKSDIK